MPERVAGSMPEGNAGEAYGVDGVRGPRGRRAPWSEGVVRRHRRLPTLWSSSTLAIGTFLARPSFQDRLEQIWRSALARGVPLPNEEVLATELGVGRPRLREALAQLEQAGIVMRSQGAATVVNPGAGDLDCRLEHRKPFDVVITEAGFEARREILASGLVSLDDRDAEMLHASPGAPALRIVKRWLADGVPARLALDVLPLDELHARPGWDPTLPVADLAAVINGSPVVWELAIPVAARATRRINQWLDLPRGTALICMDSVGMTRSGRRVYRCADYYTGIIRMGLIRTMAPRTSSVATVPDDADHEEESGA